MAAGLAAWLFGFTLIAALVVAIWRLWREHEAPPAGEPDGPPVAAAPDVPDRSRPGFGHERPRRP